MTLGSENLHIHREKARTRRPESERKGNGQTIGAVSDMHWGAEGAKPPEILVGNVLANRNMRVLVLGGDVLDRNASLEDVRRVLEQLGRLRNKNEAQRDISVIVVEGNDEVLLHPHVRQAFYTGLHTLGIDVFKPDTGRALTVHSNDGKPLASFVGIPWTLPPQQFHKIYHGVGRKQFLPEYRETYRRNYEKYVEQALREAEAVGALIYLAFHVPPFGEHYNFRRSNTKEDAQTVHQIVTENTDNSWMIKLIKEHPLIAGIFSGHISEGPSHLVEPQFHLAAVNICQQVVNRYQGQEVFEASLPTDPQNIHLARRQFSKEAKRYADERRKILYGRAPSRAA